ALLRSQPAPAAPTGTASTAAATGPPTPPYTPSPYAACATTHERRPTLSGGPNKALARKRSCAASSATSSGRSTPLYSPTSPLSTLDIHRSITTLHTVLRLLMLTRGKKKERGGFISYAQLGINQPGAVYDGLI